MNQVEWGQLRESMVVRDGCCACCRSRVDLTAQHRQSRGMGGSKRDVAIYEIVTLCGTCNVRMERDLQSAGLACGWKVRRWLKPVALSVIPVLFVGDGWYRLSPDGWKDPVSVPAAHGLMLSYYGDEWREWVLKSKAERVAAFGKVA